MPPKQHLLGSPAPPRCVPRNDLLLQQRMLIPTRGRTVVFGVAPAFGAVHGWCSFSASPIEGGTDLSNAEAEFRSGEIVEAVGGRGLGMIAPSGTGVAKSVLRRGGC
jgi:hypothetical protein